MNARFANMLNDGDGALRELQPSEFADVNGGGGLKLTSVTLTPSIDLRTGAVSVGLTITFGR
jgi:hypothetical protein